MVAGKPARQGGARRGRGSGGALALGTTRSMQRLLSEWRPETPSEGRLPEAGGQSGGKGSKPCPGCAPCSGWQRRRLSRQAPRPAWDGTLGGVVGERAPLRVGGKDAPPGSPLAGAREGGGPEERLQDSRRNGGRSLGG